MRAIAAIVVLSAAAAANGPDAVRTGPEAYGDWRSDAPGVRRLITAADLPQPYTTRSTANPPGHAPRPPGAFPQVPTGFSVDLVASGLAIPRVVRTAPNGDIFVAESGAGRVLTLRLDKAFPAHVEPHAFASGLPGVYGIAFYPPGPEPRFVYVATEGSVVRFPYRSGDLAASGPAEVVVPRLPKGGAHWTRDIAFSSDGKTMFVSVGSASNDADGVSPIAAAAAEGAPLGASVSLEEDRADVLAFDPDGAAKRVYATGLRNCSGLAVEPSGGALWCVVNERDGFGDNLPPDYATRIADGAFYGWPWYYIGDHADPRHKGERPDLASRVAVPDVLFQPHSAPLGIAFYEGDAFPAEDKGQAFVTFHGSWNRAKRTGYKVVKLEIRDGRPTGVTEDFLTGFVTNDGDVWGRPVGVTVTRDGALLVTDDESGSIWRVSYRGQ
jgi:glucose/arabinose dehydrogenase